MNQHGAGWQGQDLLPARMLNEFVYCPRLFYLEYVQGEFAHSADTVEGRFVHRRVDEETGGLLSAEEAAADPQRPAVARSLFLSAPQAGIIARMDLVEAVGSTVTPVDFKKGKTPESEPGRAWEADKVQLCAQAIVLRENGYSCTSGCLYYASSRERVTVVFDDALVQRTLRAAAEARALSSGTEIPPPLVDSPKCPRCSLVGICLPDEVAWLAGRPPGTSADSVRRLLPARDEALPVYVVRQGSVVGKKDDAIVVKEGGVVADEVRLIDISQVSLFGNVQVTAQALKALLEREIPICHLSMGGWFAGFTQAVAHKNIDLRRFQFAAAADRERSLAAARAFVEGKIRNSRTLLRRNHAAAPEAVLSELARLGDSARLAGSIETLLGVEGSAARAYFQEFHGMLKPGPEGTEPFDFDGRNRRPPKDPINALLSYLYAILAKDLTATCLAVGLDPYLGFLHQPRYGRPALALDLMEEFRPIVADSTVITLVNNGEIRQSDFIRRGGAVTLTDDARRRVLQGYERRVDSLVTHPTFGYSISYRRVFEVQTRLLARWLGGEIPEYPPFCTR